MERVTAGSVCMNEACAAYGQAGLGNLVKNGHTKAGVQRWLCRECNKAFVETKGTLFCRRRAQRRDILESLALLAEGTRISSVSRVKGVKADTVLAWLRGAAKRAEEVEESLLADYQLSRAQVDGLWTYVRHKGQKGGTSTATRPASSGAQR